MAARPLPPTSGARGESTDWARSRSSPSKATRSPRSTTSSRSGTSNSPASTCPFLSDRSVGEFATVLSGDGNDGPGGLLMKLRTLGVVGAMAFVPAITPALASEAAHPAVGDTSVFATVPAPGHPFGVAVDKNRVYISTSAGDFFASPATGGHLNSDGERVFAYDKRGNLVKTTSIATMPNSDMGLFGLALDGNPTPTHNLYVADMNGRILRLALDRDAPPPQVFAQTPPPFTGLGWHASMWNDLVFDKAGNLFMTDDKPRLWKVTPDGQASGWFTDPKIGGLFGFAGGPLGGRVGPRRQYLVFTNTLLGCFSVEAVG